MKTMLITGGTGAIGSMTAYLAVRKGYQVIFGYHSNQEAAKNLEEDLSKLGGKVLAVPGNLLLSEDRQKLVNTALEVFGSIDLLVNNWGIARYCEFTQETEDSIADGLNQNLFSHLALTRLCLPAMLHRKSGSIINISSIWGQTGGSCEVVYSAAKAGLIGFTKALAKELAPSGITVNCVAPGCVAGKMLRGLDIDALKSEIPTGKLCNGLDIAKAVLFLAEQEQITGQVLAPNGGMYI